MVSEQNGAGSEAPGGIALILDIDITENLLERVLKFIEHKKPSVFPKPRPERSQNRSFGRVSMAL